jgi:hypothetical protein
MRRGLAAAVAVMIASAAAAPAHAARTPQGVPERLRAMQSSKAPTSPQSSPATQPAGQTVETGQAATTHGLHYVRVKFDYDFGKTPACSAKVKTKCVEKFVAYDISGGVKNRVKLFEIPLPSKPEGVVPGITQKSPTKLDFESGKHLISVAAREPDGTESKHRACTTWIDIP